MKHFPELFQIIQGDPACTTDSGHSSVTADRGYPAGTAGRGHPTGTGTGEVTQGN